MRAGTGAPRAGAVRAGAARATETEAKARGRRRAGTASLVAGGALVLVVVALALVSLFWTPYDPAAQDRLARFSGMSAAHPFGTDQFGRDILSRVMVSAQTALLSGVASVLIGAAVGVALGLVAALSGRGVRTAVMRLADAMMAFPGILLALMLIMVMGRGLTGTLVAISIFMVPSFCRLTCSLALEEEGRPYVLAARSYGSSRLRLALTQIMPNIAPRIVTQLTSSVGTAILLEASLSFLGLGVQPPGASWGTMISEAMQYVLVHPGLVVAPSVALVLCVLGFNLLGDGLNDRLVEGGGR